MSLWNKFSNIKKIGIFIILFIIIVLIIIIVCIRPKTTLNTQSYMLANENLQNIEVATGNIIIENEEENIQEEVNQEIIKNETIVTQEDKTEEKQADTTKSNKVENQTNTSTEIQTNTNKNQNSTQIENVTNNKGNNNQVNSNSSQISNTQPSNSNNQTNDEQTKNEQQNVEIKEEQVETNTSLANTHFSKYNAEKTAHAVAYINKIIKQKDNYSELGGEAVAVTQKPCKNWFSYSYDEKLNPLAITGCTIKVYIEDEYAYDSKGINYYLYDTKAYIYQY